MFSFKPKTLLFSWKKEEIRNIHMFFVFFPIDVVWLDKKKRVIYSKRKLLPFSLTNIDKSSKYIIEVPYGIIKKTRTKNGDLISF